MKVMIINNWGSNKGDKAVLQFLINRLERLPEVTEVFVSTSAPTILKKTFFSHKIINFVPFSYNMRFYGTDIFSKLCRRFYYWVMPFYYNSLMKKIIKDKYDATHQNLNSDFVKALVASDIVIGTGGHHFTTMRDKNMVSHLTYDVGIVHLFHKPLYLWSQTIGPLDFTKQINKQYINKIIEKSKILFIREKQSISLISHVYPNICNIYETYDSVFGLFGDYKDSYLTKNPKKAGVSIFNANKRNSKQKENYKNLMSNVILMLLKLGYDISIFPMEVCEDEMILITEIIQQLTSYKSRIVIEDTNITTKMHIIKVSECSIYVGHKTHSIIFSLITNTPILAISYHSKTDEFMKMYNMIDFVVQETTNIDEIEKKLTKLHFERNSLNKSMIEKNQEFSKKVIADFDIIFGNKI